MNREQDGKNSAKSAVFYTISNIISIIASFVAIKILSSAMTTSDMGIATSFITLLDIFGYICLFSLNISINRAMIDFKEEKEKYLSSVYIFSSLSVFFFFGIYLIFKDFINGLFGFSTELMLLLFLLMFCINGYNLTFNKWNFQNKYKRTFTLTLLSSPISQALSVILVLYLSTNKYLGRIIGVELFQAIMGILFGIMILIQGKFFISKKHLKYGLKFSVPMIPHLLSQILLANCDLLMIKNMIGSSEAGLYSMSYTIATILYMVLVQILRPWSPWVYRRLEEKEPDTIKNKASLLISFCFICCIGLCVVAPDLIKIFLDKSYLNSIYLVAPICVGLFFRIIYIFFYDIEYFHKKTKQIAVISITVCVINIILNYFFIREYGYQAAAYTTLASYLILALFNYIGAKRIIDKPIYDHKYFLLISILCMTTSMCSLVFINNLLIRYGILLLSFIIIALLQKSNIKYLMSLLKGFINKK